MYAVQCGTTPARGPTDRYRNFILLRMLHTQPFPEEMLGSGKFLTKDSSGSSVALIT